MTENETKIYIRVKEEYINLCEKISLLELSLFDNTLDISIEHTKLLRRQLLKMRDYKNVLLDRINDITRHNDSIIKGGEEE